MKKLLPIVLSLSLILALSACGAQGGAAKAASPISVTVQAVEQDCYSDDAAHSLLLKYSDDVPTVTIPGSDAAQSAVNLALQKEVLSFKNGSGDGTDGLDAYLAMAKDEYSQSSDLFLSGSCYAMDRHVSVARGDEAVLSFVYSAYINLHGAHGTSAVYSANFDAATGAALTIDDIADNAQSLKDFCGNYLLTLAKGSDYADVEFFDGCESTLKELAASGSWYFSDKGLVFAASAGDIAPYAAGELRFTVPYDKLGSLLKQNYLPRTVSGSAGDMSITGASSTANPETVGSVALDKDGQIFRLTASGELYGVTLSSVNYGEDGSFTQEGTKLYFSALGDGDTIGVQAVIPEGAPNLMVSWHNPDGTTVQKLISQSGKDGSLLLIDNNS